jgi:hypothetical protein
VLVAREQVVEEEVANPLRLRIQSHPRIKVRRARFDDHHQGLGRRFAGAGEQERAQQGNDDRAAPWR